MIARIEGQLESIAGNTAYVRMPMGDVGSLTYEVMLPAYVAARLQGDIGKLITLHTLHFVESVNQGAVMMPRVAGFRTSEDRRFYELFCTCKGIGHRRALRALALSVDQIAAAIVDRDLAILQSLPEVGKRTAETIVTTLRDKVQPFVVAQYDPDRSHAAAAGDDGGAAGNAKSAPSVAPGMAREALEVLLQLGESRTDAVRWIDQAMIADDDDRPSDTQGLVNRVFQLKAGA